MMELYENSVDLNFNLNSLEFEHMEDVIMFGGNKSNGSDSGNSADGIPIKQRNQANARERFRTHRFVRWNCDQ